MSSVKNLICINKDIKFEPTSINQILKYFNSSSLIKLQWYSWVDYDFKKLSRFTNLIELNLRICNNLFFLDTPEKLIELKLGENCQVEDFYELLNSQKLSKLVLKDCYGIGVSELDELTSLTELSLSNCGLQYLYLGNLTNLRRFQLIGFDELETADGISELTKLTKLDLRNSPT